MEKIQKWKTKFIIVALGQAVSMLGSHGVQFALIWWLAENTSSPLMLGISGIVAYLPMSLFSPLAEISAACDIIYHSPACTERPTYQNKRLDAAIKLWFFLLGPVIGASLYAIFPMSVVLMSDVVGAILASIALIIVKIPKLEKAETEKQHFVQEMKEGIKVFREDSKLFYIVLAEALCMFFYAPLSSFYPLMTSDYFDLSAMYGSAVELSFAIGMMLSSLLFSSVFRVKRKIRVSFIGLFGMGVTSAICGVISPVYAGWYLFAACCICLGAAGNVHTIPLTSYIQETVAPEKMGRAFSVLTLISSVTMPIGLLFSSPIAEKVGVNVWFFISGLCMLTLTTLVLIRYKVKQRWL